MSRHLPPPPQDLELAPGSLVTVGECTSPPATADWLHEIKVDGWRVALLTDGQGGMRLQTRKGSDRTWDFQEAVGRIAHCGHQMIIDGEIAVPDVLGLTKLHSLHAAMRGGRTSELAYFAFDLLQLDGENLRQMPMEQRKAVLDVTLTQIKLTMPLPRVNMVDSIMVPGPDVFRAAQNLGAEGIVSKRIGSPYIGSDKPSVTWVKSICKS